MKNDWITQQYIIEMTHNKETSLFYKDETGNIVMTEQFHINRGFCCGNKCLHCAYNPPYIKNNTTLRNEIQNR